MFPLSYFIGFIFSTLYASLFHLWKGGGLGRFIFYLGLSWVGFWIGHWVGVSVHLAFGKLGTLQFASATLGAILCLVLGYWLSLIRIQPQ